jgi:hypothetical protein
MGLATNTDPSSPPRLRDAARESHLLIMLYNVDAFLTSAIFPSQISCCCIFSELYAILCIRRLATNTAAGQECDHKRACKIVQLFFRTGFPSLIPSSVQAKTSRMELSPVASCSYRTSASLSGRRLSSVLRPQQAAFPNRSGQHHLQSGQLIDGRPGLLQPSKRQAVRARVFNNGSGGKEDFGDRVVATIPYLLPLLDALPFGEDQV